MPGASMSLDIRNFLIVFIVLIAIVVLFLKFYNPRMEKRKIAIYQGRTGKKLTEVDVEIADNMLTRSKGLMGRKQLEENDGMLFVFDKPDRYGFWMVNTTIPLDAIFFDENKTIVDIIEMEPCGFTNISKCKIYKPKSKAMYVLEVNKGYAKRKGIKEGDWFKFIDE